MKTGFEPLGATGLHHSLPKIVRWDVDFRGRIGRPKRIARQIREIAPEFVELRFDGDGGIAELSAIVTEIHKAHPRMEATVRLAPKAVAASRWGYPVSFLWAFDPRRPFSHCIAENARAVSFTPEEETIRLLPDVLREFARSAAEELHLPNVSAVRALASKGHVPVPRSGQFREVAKALEARRVSLAGKRLVVHDFFLYRTLREVFAQDPGTRVEFSGCRAGSQLVYVDWEGNVYPCDSIPIRLGNLLPTPLERIWKSPQRLQVAEAIQSVPADCDTCMEHSGCRGLAHFESGLPLSSDAQM